MAKAYDRVDPKSPEDEYVSGIDACKLIGCAHKHLKTLIDEKRIGTWQVPGSRVRYSKRDCQAAAAAAFQPARSSITPGGDDLRD